MLPFLLAALTGLSLGLLGGGGSILTVPILVYAAKIDPNSWELPEIFQWLQTEGNIDITEMYRVLNCGVGMVVVVPEAKSQLTIDHLNICGEKAWLIGEVVKSNGKQILI